MHRHKCNAYYKCIGIAIGSLLGGYIFERYGGPVMFRCFGGLSLAIGILYSLSNNLLIDRNQIRKKSTRKGTQIRHNKTW